MKSKSLGRREVLAALGACLWTCAVHANDAANAGVPAFKVSTAAGRSSILIGSAHVGLEGLRQPNASVFKGIKRYVVEQVPGEGPPAKRREPWPPAFEELQRTGKLGRAPWAEQLTDTEVGELRRRIVCSGVPFAKAQNALAAVLALASPLTAAEVAIRPCAPGTLPSRDQVLAEYARQQGIPTSSLELNAEVEPRRQAVPDRIHLHHMRIAMSERQKQALIVTRQALNGGEFELVNREIDSLAANAEDAALYERLMITERNEAWMPRLMEYLEQGDAFINVGASHLPGPKGLVALLRQAGLSVEPIALPAAGGTGLASTADSLANSAR